LPAEALAKVGPTSNVKPETWNVELERSEHPMCKTRAYRHEKAYEIKELHPKSRLSPGLGWISGIDEASLILV
jgi:hypothetical protein